MMAVDTPDLHLYENLANNTLLYYNNHIINSGICLELPVDVTCWHGYIHNDFNNMMQLIVKEYPFGWYLDEYLQKEFTHKINKKCQEVIRYVKQYNDKVKEFTRRDHRDYTYEVEHNNLPILDYVDFAVYATTVIGKEAASYFITYYEGSKWYCSLHLSPNVYVDIVKLKKFAKAYDLEYTGPDEIDDAEYIAKDEWRNFSFPKFLINETVHYPEKYSEEELTKMIPVLKELIPFLKTLLPEIVEQLAPNIVAEVTKQIAPEPKNLINKNN
jgi:hypothetical protein